MVRVHLALVLVHEGGGFGEDGVDAAEGRDLDGAADGDADVLAGVGSAQLFEHGVGFLFGFSFFPYTLIVIALFGISLPQYLICYLLNDPIQKNIISPWERMQAQKET